MAPATETKEVLVLVRTYPNPSKANVEVSCTAGLTRDGSWIRLFPIPYRFLEGPQRFHKYQWIKVNARKAADHRVESYAIDVESLEIISEPLSTDHDWRERKNLVLRDKAHCMCCLRKQRDKHKAPTLGVFRPKVIKGLAIEPADAQWSEGELASLRQEQDQGALFGAVKVTELEKVPYAFKYQFVCNHDGCKGHTLSCTDWEMLQSWREWRDKYGDKWQAKFREKYERQMIEKYDTHFFVGTLKAHPGEWNVVGLFYPPKTTGDLFGPN